MGSEEAGIGAEALFEGGKHVEPLPFAAGSVDDEDPAVFGRREVGDILGPDVENGFVGLNRKRFERGNQAQEKRFEKLCITGRRRRGRFLGANLRGSASGALRGGDPGRRGPFPGG